MIKTVSTSQIESLLEEGHPKLRYFRPVDVYNGWDSSGNGDGGHIPGSKSLPAVWSNYIDWIEIVRSKGLITILGR